MGKSIILRFELNVKGEGEDARMEISFEINLNRIQNKFISKK